VTAVVTSGTEELIYRRVRGAGASVVRILFYWNSVAPGVPPPEFDASNPADSAYRWKEYDDAIRHAVDNGLEPLLSVFGTPAWAETAKGPFAAGGRPDLRAYRQFVTAAAKRYSGRFAGLPRVQYWQAWNEPNVNIYLHPQVENRSFVSPAFYRRLLGEFRAAVRSVNDDNLVVAGGLSPFANRRGDVVATAPLRFLRHLVCVSAGTPRRTCRSRVAFDVWAHHPYTANGPRGAAQRPDDAALGDLVEMRRLLVAAQRLGQIRSRRPVQLWVTEFSWDSSPPDPQGVPAALHARWVAEALHHMWSSGVSLVAWFTLRDSLPPPASIYQSGLWYRGATLRSDRPKPALRAFRFPLVAYHARGRIDVWGRTPAGMRGRVVLERRFRGGWARMRVVRTDRHGIFTARFAGSGSGAVRGTLIGSRERSRPFSLVRPPVRRYNPFGS
jgi:hypothetical protein